jgi:hypothetical protein
MVLLGVDPHKDTHTSSRLIRPVGSSTRPPCRHAPSDMASWSAGPDTSARAAPGGGRLPACVRPAGTRSAGRRERVVRVPPRLMAGARQAVRALGKSDAIDALPPCASPPSPSPSMIRRPGRSSCRSTIVNTLVAEPTRTINRLRWQLHQLDPDLEHTTRRLRGSGLDRITTRLAQAAADASCLVQVTSCQAKSPPSRPSAARSVSWTVNSASVSPSWPHRCCGLPPEAPRGRPSSACLAAGR